MSSPDFSPRTGASSRRAEPIRQEKAAARSLATRKVFDAAGGPPGATRRAMDIGRQAAS